MKKICFIVYNMSVIGGVEQVTKTLTDELVKNYEVHVLSLLKTGELKYKLDNKVQYEYLSTQESRFSEMQKQLKKPIAAYLKKNNIDIAFIQGTFPAYITFPVRFFCKTKLVFCDHGALRNQWDDKKTTLARFLSSLFCHKTVALTKQTYDDYHKKFFVPYRKLRYIYNWVDLSVSRSEEYSINSKRIISAGRISKEKGFDMLVKAFAPVAQKHSDWHLDIFGDGDMMDIVKQTIAEYKIENNVHLMGMRADLSEQYRNYAMYVLASYREGMPLVLLEAKANRLPIVSFDIMTGPREIVRDNIDGILVEPYNLEKMSDAICSLIENTDRRIQMSQASQKNLYKFSKQEILIQWKHLIESLT